MFRLENKKCFVIIPFADSFEEVFTHAIKAAAEERGYTCERMKEITGPINIVDELIRNIFEAGVIVADLTTLNPNVLYELGIAHSIPQWNKTIIIVEKGETIPFDLTVYQFLEYSRSYEGVLALRKEIKDRIDYIESQQILPATPVQDFLFKQRDYGKKAVRYYASKVSRTDELVEILYNSHLGIEILHCLSAEKNAAEGLV